MKNGHIFCGLTLLMAVTALVAAGAFGHVPPSSAPHTTVAQVTNEYREHSHGLLVFALFNMISSVLLLPFCCGLSILMLRMGRSSLLLASLQVVGGVFAIIGPFLASMFIAAGAARPDAPGNIVASLNDLAVIFIELSTLPALFQGLGVALAIFADRSADPILPRWLAWIGIIWGIAAQGGVTSVFFTAGPFSPSGVVGITIPMVSLIIWWLAVAISFLTMRSERWREADHMTAELRFQATRIDHRSTSFD